MIKIIYLTFIISSIHLLFANPPDWEDCAGCYEFTATISGAVILNEGVQLGDDGDIFAAFDDDGNNRGIALQLFPPFGPYQGTPVYEMQMRSNAEGDLLHFKYYDASEDAILDIVETYEFVINDILGDVVDPWIMNIGVPDLSCPECTDDDASLAPVGGCAAAVGMFGCDFVWAGETLNELCPASCGTCPEEDACGVCEGDGSSCTDCAGTPNGDAEEDCAGECNGSAVVDECGVCDDDVSNDCEQDCAGTWGGTEVLSGCDNTCSSTATEDMCGTCDDDASNDCVQDCAGTWGGIEVLSGCDNTCSSTATEDMCGTCDADASNDCVQDCFDVWGGTDFDQGCGCGVYDQLPTDGCDDVCGSTAYEDNCNTCDDDASNDCVEDCAGTWGGTEVLSGCDNTCSSTAVVDECGECGGDGSSCQIEVLYSSDADIGGFQFNVDGVSGVIGASGGDAEANGFEVSTSEMMVLGFSFTGSTIPAGSGVLTVLQISGDTEAACLSGLVLSDPDANGLDATVEDCLTIFYEAPCDDADADGICDEVDDCVGALDCAGECNGSAVEDDCGVCDGGNADDLGCGCFLAGPSGCDNACGSTLENDECGVCGGSGIPDGECDCAGNVLDECGVCGGDGSPCGDETIDYCLSLHAGANLKSFYALPEDVSVPNIMSGLGTDVTGVITEGGACSQIAPGTWVGSQCSLLPEKGYWIIVTSANDLCLENATPTDPAIEYSLHSGANLISFSSDGAVGVSDALPDDVESSVAGVITEGGACSQIAPGQWVGSQCAFNGGKGYWMITTASISFSFDLTNLSIGRIKTDSGVGLIHPKGMEVIQSTKQAFYFIENIMINGMPIQTGDWVLAYYDNTLVGAGKWGAPYSEVPAMGNDGMSETDGYCKAGSKVRLKILQENTGEYYQVLESLPNWQDNGLFTLGKLTAREMPEEIMLESAYPNPFNPVTHISFGIDTDTYVQVKVYDITGKEIATLADGTYFSGYHNLTWNADNFASGMYFVRLEAGNFIQTQKLLLLK